MSLSMLGSSQYPDREESESDSRVELIVFFFSGDLSIIADDVILDPYRGPLFDSFPRDGGHGGSRYESVSRR